MDGNDLFNANGSLKRKGEGLCGCKFGDRGGKKGWYSKPDNNTEEIKALVDTLPPEPDRSNWVAITGKTFELKDSLKHGFGARWNADDKVWMVDPSKAKDAQDMVDYSAVHLPSRN